MRKVTFRAVLPAVFAFFLACHAALAAEPRLVARAGKGALYEVDGQRVAILAGSPEEMGRQQGVLLKEDVRAMLNTLLTYCRVADNYTQGNYFAGSIEQAYERCGKFIPDRYLREMDALADAAGAPRRDVRLANVFPELFHCSGFALMGRATEGGELLHGRILDYMTEIGLQNHAVTFVHVPDGRHAFVNVGYAGFVGSVTGMNEKKVAFGEMGGAGHGLWDGMPMGFLMRKGMEEADTLDEALAIFRETPRTCEYYYVISDGKARNAAGLYCTPDTFETVGPGDSHPRLPMPVPDAVLLSAGNRYHELVRRVKEQYGRFDAAAARDLMKRPIAMSGNLHCVLFAPERLTLWAAHAADPATGSDFRACDQPYVRLEMPEWLQRAAALKDSAASPEGRTETRIPDTPGEISGVGHDAARPPLAPADTPDMEALLGPYRLPRAEFLWHGKLLANTRNFAIYSLEFPSAVETPYPENNTVWCEYYRTHGAQPRPAVVVLHILDGSFVVARLICSTLANSGIDAVMLKLPFYGERRPADLDAPLQDPELFKLLITQGMADVRRASALLAGMDHVPDDQVGLSGVSLNGFVSALTAGVDGNYRRATFILAGGGLQAVLTTGSRETAEIQERFAQAGLSGERLADFLGPIDPLTFAKRLKRCEVVMLNVTGDEVIPQACVASLADAAGGKEIVWYEGDKHTSMVRYLFNALGRVRSHFAPDAW